MQIFDWTKSDDDKCVGVARADVRFEQGMRHRCNEEMFGLGLIQQIIRAGDYADPHLAQLSVDAVDLWRKKEWEGTYHE